MKHVKAIYARHICQEPEHLLKDFPEGLRNTPILIGQRCVVTIGLTNIIDGMTGCNHIKGPIEQIMVHYLDQQGDLHHRFIGTACLDFDPSSEDLDKAKTLYYLMEISIQ